MKKLFTLFLIVMSISLIDAQYYLIPNINAKKNPGGLNNDPEYPVGGGLPTTWATVHTGSKTNPTWSTAKTLPIPFSFNGQVVTKYRVCSNGIVSFDTAATLPVASYTRGTLPDAKIPNNSVCIWGIAGIGSNDNVVAKSFGTAPNRQYWLQFSSYGYGTTTSDGTNYTYWSIVFEETTNHIYIVDNRNGGYTAATKLVSAGIQIDATTAIVVPKSPDLAPLSASDPTPADNTYYEFRPGSQPKFDAKPSSIDVNSYLTIGQQDITGSFINNGTDEISSIDLSYRIDGGQVVTSAFSNLTVGVLKSYNFTHPIKWDATTGVHNIEVWTSNINGNADEFSSDDTIRKNVVVYSRNIGRIPLYEIFTSSTCPPCVPGNINYHKIVDTKNQADFVSIKYQQNFPGNGDPYATTESINRKATYYAINSIPRMEIDGGWDGNAQQFSEALYTSSRARQAGFDLEGTYSVDPTTKTISANIKYSPAFDATGYKLYVAINENLTTMNVATNGETEFKNVMKKMLPNETGTTINTLADGVQDSISFVYTFNGEYRLPINGLAANIINHATENSVENFDNLVVVAWVQGPDKVVQQAANLKQLIGTDVKDLLSVKEIKTFPNPTVNQLNISFNAIKNDNIEISLYNLSGQLVKTMKKSVFVGENRIEMNTTDVQTGSYYLSISDSKNNVNTSPITILK